jgi:hypothetical protein
MSMIIPVKSNMDVFTVMTVIQDHNHESHITPIFASYVNGEDDRPCMSITVVVSCPHTLEVLARRLEDLGYQYLRYQDVRIIESAPCFPGIVWQREDGDFEWRAEPVRHGESLHPD